MRTTCNVLGQNGDQNSGCRKDWITFCDKSLIPSFKNNHFNCHFEATAAVIYNAHNIKNIFKIKHS